LSLITSDRDFARRLSFLIEVGYDVLLIHGPLVSETMKAIVPTRLDWQTLCGVNENSQASDEPGLLLPLGHVAEHRQPLPLEETTSISHEQITRTGSTAEAPQTLLKEIGNSTVVSGSKSAPILVLQNKADSMTSFQGLKGSELTVHQSDPALGPISHFELIARLDRPKTSLDLWTSFGLLYWIQQGCFHLTPGTAVPAHVFRCLTRLAGRGLLCTSAPLQANPPVGPTYVFLTASGLVLWQALCRINDQTGRNGSLYPFRHAVYFWMERAMKHPDSDACQSGALGSMLSPVLKTGIVKAASGAPYTSVSLYLQDAVSKGVFKMDAMNNTDGRLTLQPSFQSLWVEVKNVCTTSNIAIPPNVSASALGSNVSERLIAALPTETLPFMPLLLIIEHSNQFKGPVDLKHVSHMLGYLNLKTYVREALEAGLLTHGAANRSSLTPKALGLVQAFEHAKGSST